VKPRCIVADNPGPFTLDGTRTYLVGHRRVAVIDPGPDVESHVRAVVNAVAEAEDVRVLLTHGHADHVGAAEAVAGAVGAQILGVGIPAARALGDRETVETDQGRLVSIDTPGHSREHVAFHWIEADAPRGEGSDPLEEIPTLARTWTMGEPDLVVDLGTQKLPATGLIDYLYIDKELSLDHDVWVRAVEILPGNLAVVHHILASVIYPEAFTSPIETEERWLDGIFAAYVPGIETETFPEGTGRILPAGSKLRFQVHYTVTGRPETDTTKFGIYFSDKPAEKEFLIVGPANSEIEIPPGAKAYQASTERVFNQEVTLYGMFPHMHFRGKSMSYEAHYPDGSTEMLLSVPNYNFNWQRFYTFGAGKVLPAGTKIVCRATFDNSSQNPFNPDPTKTIHWGEQSFDEMLIGYMSLTYGTLGQRSE